MPGEGIEFFDCNAYAGAGLFPPLEPALVPEALLDEMDHCGVDSALMNHDGGDFSNPLRHARHHGPLRHSQDLLRPSPRPA